MPVFKAQIREPGSKDEQWLDVDFDAVGSLLTIRTDRTVLGRYSITDLQWEGHDPLRMMVEDVSFLVRPADPEAFRETLIEIEAVEVSTRSVRSHVTSFDWIAVGVVLLAVAVGAGLISQDHPFRDRSDATSNTQAVEASNPAVGLTDLGGRTVTVGVENAYLPFNYVLLGESEGQGWDYDVWREICRLLNCQAAFIEASWPQIIDEVARGDLNAAADGLSITFERSQIVDYSNSYMVVEQKFVVQKGEDRYGNAQDVIDSDAIVATQVGTTNYELAESLVGAGRVQGFARFDLSIQALIAGEVDAVIIDDAVGLGYIGADADEIETIHDGLQFDPLGFMFPQGSDLVGPVNQAIAELKSNGFFDAMGLKWFGPGFTLTYDDIEL